MSPRARSSKPAFPRDDGRHMGQGDEIVTADVAWPPDRAEIDRKRLNVDTEVAGRGKRVRLELDVEYANGAGVARWLVERVPPDPCAGRTLERA